jgi:hypothetical protein
MSVVQPIYRMTVYEPRHEDPTETTVLTPIAGAAHSDAFRVATKTGVSGYQPYMDVPSGRQGGIDPLTKQTDTGSLRVRLLDRRTGTTNLERWVTAFMGDEEGKPRLGGCKVYIELSENDGSSWLSYFTGRINDIELDGKLWVMLEIHDMAMDLDIDVFVGEPHSSISYYLRPALLPVSLVDEQLEYANFPQRPRLRGTYKTDLIFAPRAIEIDTADLTRIDNLVTKELQNRNAIIRNSIDYYTREFVDTARVIMERTDTQASGQFRFRGYAEHAWARGPYIDEENRQHPRVFGIEEVDSSHPDYMPLPPNGTSIEFYIVPQGKATEKAPIVLTGVHPGQLIEDLLDGKWSLLDDDGSVRFTVGYDSTALTAIQNDDTFPGGRFVATEVTTVREVLRRICQQYNLAHYLNEDGEVVIVDMRTPSSLPSVPTIDNDDLVSEIAPRWRLSRSDAITVVEGTYYVDDQEEDFTQGGVPDLSCGGLSSVEGTVLVADFSDSSLGEKRASLDASFYRATIDERMDSGFLRLMHVQSRLAGLLASLKLPFGNGARIAELVVRSTTTAAATNPGDLRIIDVDELPDPGTNERGGSRLMRCIRKQREGLKVHLSFLDTALYSQATVPTVGTLAATSGDSNGIDVPITLNGDGQRVIIEAAVTEASVGTRPADDSELWGFAAEVTSSSTVSISPYPRPKRIWVRARTEPLPWEAQLIPSNWAYPSGNDYLDLTALTAPSGLSVAESATWAEFEFTVGESGAFTDVYLESPAGDGFIRIRRLPPGQDRWAVYGLESGTQYRLEIEHVDRYGSSSSRLGETFTTLGSAPTLPDLAGIDVRQGELLGTYP